MTHSRKPDANAAGDVPAGFLTTFTMLARDRLSLRQMSWILVKVFFGYGGEIPWLATTLPWS